MKIKSKTKEENQRRDSKGINGYKSIRLCLLSMAVTALLLNFLISGRDKSCRIGLQKEEYKNDRRLRIILLKREKLQLLNEQAHLLCLPAKQL